MTLLFVASQGTHTARASIPLENPREAVLFQSTNVNTTDYVADQIDILRSAELARRSSGAAMEVDASFPYDTIDYLTRAIIVGGDADFESRELSRMLAPEAINRPGLSDLIDGATIRGDALTEVATPSGHLSLLSQGKRSVSEDEAALLMEAIVGAAEPFDVVLLDVPANLSDPRMAALVEGSNRIVALVGHGDRMFSAERLRDDLESLASVCDGVVFTRMPGQRMNRAAVG